MMMMMRVAAKSHLFVLAATMASLNGLVVQSNRVSLALPPSPSLCLSLSLSLSLSCLSAWRPIRLQSRVCGELFGSGNGP